MGLTSALQIGRSGLLAARSAIEVAGQNLANMATPGYHRRSVSLAPLANPRLPEHMAAGRGVQIQQILRHLDGALEGRIRNSIADRAASAARSGVLQQIESVHQELTDADLSTRLSAFLSAFSELANSPDDSSLRVMVVQEGQNLAQFMQTIRHQLVELQGQQDQATNTAATTANHLLGRIADLGAHISQRQATGQAAHSLRDQRDQQLAELSELIPVSVLEHGAGKLDVHVGSLPVILNNSSRGVEVRRQTRDGQPVTELIISDDASVLNVTSGHIGALLSAQRDDVGGAIETLDQFAGHLIYQVNRIHSQGQGLALHEALSAIHAVENADVALNDDDTGLEFDVGHGSFQIHVTRTTTGQRATHTVRVDLDGLGGNDTTLNDLAATISAIDELTATIDTSGRLQITTNPGDLAIGFSDDSSGVLAALGINTYFAGTDAADIGVHEVVSDDVRFIAASQNHSPTDNRNALAIAELRTRAIGSLNHQSLTQRWSTHIQDLAMRTAQTEAHVEADRLVVENLTAQQQHTSGVNADEEVINLLSFQRTFQSSARFLQVVDELTQTILQLL